MKITRALPPSVEPQDIQARTEGAPNAALASALRGAKPFAVSAAAEAAVSRCLKALARGEISLVATRFMLASHASAALAEVILFHRDAIADDLPDDEVARFDAECDALTQDLTP